MQPFKCTDNDLRWIVDRLDDTGGYLVKESELRFFIEHFVRLDREERTVWKKIKRFFRA